MEKLMSRLRSEAISLDAVAMLDREDVVELVGHDREIAEALSALREGRCQDTYRHSTTTSSPLICYGSVSLQ